jgi:double zinc ribbon protein
MRCAKCGAENPAGKRFCGDCGAALANRCARCGAENPPEKKFCGDCGSALGQPVVGEGGKPSTDEAPVLVRIAPERQASETIEGERKTVTALFADIKGSTELMEDLDPAEEARTIVDPALKLMIDAAHRYDGYIVQSTGDGIFALFGGRRSRMRTIRNARCMRRCACRKSCAATLRRSARHRHGQAQYSQRRETCGPKKYRDEELRNA